LQGRGVGEAIKDIVSDEARRRMMTRPAVRLVFSILIGCLLFAPGALTAAQQVNQPDNVSARLGNTTTESETSMAVSGSTIAVGWNDTRDGIDFDSLTGYGYSNDGGATFIDLGQLSSPPGFTYLGDPSLAADRHGNIYFGSLIVDDDDDQDIAVTRSASLDPLTFGPPAIITGLTPGAMQDKEHIAVDTSGGPNDGRVYVAWTEITGDWQGWILFTRSTSTDPLVFAPPIALTPADVLYQGAMPVVAPNGDVYVVWGRFDRLGGPAIADQSIQIMRSTDGGVSFHNPDPADPSPIKNVASLFPAPGLMSSGGVQPRTRGFPAIAVDQTPVGSPTHSNLYVVYQARPSQGGADRADVFFTGSSDGGQSWSPPLSVNKAPAVTSGADGTTNDNWQPAIAVSPTTGEIAVSFYDRRRDPTNFMITLFQAVSTDGGLTWVNEPASTGVDDEGLETIVGFAPAVGYDPVIHPNYMGDYNHSTGMGDEVAHVWTDLRNLCSPPAEASRPCFPPGRPDMDVYSNVRELAPVTNLESAEGGEFAVFSAMATPEALSATPAASLTMAATPEGAATTDSFAQVYDAECAPAFQAVEASLAAAQEPVAQMDQDRGIIQTASVPVDNAELQRIVAPDDADSVGQKDGRYVLAFHVRCLDPGGAAAAPRSVVAIESQIVINEPASANLIGGRLARSSGVLETEHLEAIAQSVPPVSPNLAVVTVADAPVLPVAEFTDLPLQMPTESRVLVVDNLDEVLEVTALLPEVTPEP
jgi:hypothetical protein